MSQDPIAALERHLRNAERTVKAFGLAAGPEGREIRERHLKALTEFIANKRAPGCPTNKTRSMASLTPDVWLLIAGVPDIDIAHAALAGVINATASPPKDDGDDENGDTGMAQEAKRIIGRQVEWQVHGFHLKHEHKTLGHEVECAAAFKTTIGARRAVHRRKMLKAGLMPEQWTPGERLRVGNWAFDCCLQALPGIVITGDWGEPQIAETEWATARELALAHMPKVFRPALKRPKPWTSFYNEDRQPFLRHCRDEQTAKSFPMRRHVDAVSYLQSTPWRTNEPVLKFIQELGKWERPPLLGFNSRQSWHPRDRANWHVFDWDMYWAERLIARGRPFWTEMYCDFRGRVYAFPHFNYGRGDYVRALFRFHHGAPITDRGIFWLKVATANRYNEGKNTENAITRLSFEDRAQWTDEHLDRIRGLADDPMSGLLHRAPDRWLEKADDPFQFLAHCIELTRALKSKNFKTTLPISFDASNSGAQQYSLLGRDADGARLTNLTSGNIEDLYGEVLSVIQRKFAVLIDEAKKGAQTQECRWAMWLLSQEKFTESGREPFIGRKTFKMLIVAFLYGQQEQGTEKKILRALGVKKDDPPPGLLDWFVDLVRGAIEKALPGATKIMGFTRDIAEMFADAGKTLWMHSPTGVPVCNLEYKPDLQRPKLWLDNKPVRHCAVVDDLDEIDVAACKRGAAANLVHSLDASHLAFVALACECAGIPLACVHDSFGTLACHVDELREILLRELRAMYENIDPLQDIYDRARVALGPTNRTWPILPSRGSLDLSQVNGPYAFS